MAVVNVSHVEVGALAGQAAGAERGDTALVRKLGQRVRLIHELAQRAGAKELLDRRRDGTDVDQALGRDDVEILQSHALADHALHAGETDAELVLQQLTHAADAAVAEMVDIVRLADAVREAAEIVRRGEDIVADDVLRHEKIHVLLEHFLKLFALILLHVLAQEDEADALAQTELFLDDAAVLRIVVREADEIGGIDHAVGEDADGLVLADGDTHGVNALLLQLADALAGKRFAGVGDDLAGHRVGNGLSQSIAGNARVERELLVELVAADVGNVVPAVVEEEVFEQGLAALHRRGVAGTELLVDLEQAVIAGDAGVALERGDDALVVAEDLAERVAGDGAAHGIVNAAEPGVRLVRLVSAESLEQKRGGQLAVLVDADIEHVVQIRLILEPRAVVRNDGRAVHGAVGLVRLLVKVNTGRTDDLRDDNALGAVDDERAARGHEREIAHEDLLFLDLLGLTVAQTHADLQRGGVCGVTRLALLLRILGRLVHGIIHEGELQVAGVVRNGSYALEDFPQALVQKPLIGILLDLEQVRHVLDLFRAGIALSDCSSVLYVLRHRRISLFPPEELNSGAEYPFRGEYGLRCRFDETPGCVVKTSPFGLIFRRAADILTIVKGAVCGYP